MAVAGPVVLYCSFVSTLLVNFFIYPAMLLSDLKVEEEVAQIAVEIVRLGSSAADGSVEVTFGVLFDDDRCQQVFEALVGTLKAAKKRGVVSYSAPVLLKGAHEPCPFAPPGRASNASGEIKSSKAGKARRAKNS